MKTFLLTIVTFIVVVTARAQYYQNFEGNAASLTGSCWSLTGVVITNDQVEVINGGGSMISNPPVNGTNTSDLVTPALNLVSNPLVVSFTYKLTSAINGSSTRTIELGVLDVAGNYSILRTITLDNTSPTTVQNFVENFTLATVGRKKLVLKISGSQGDGNSRLVVDDFYTNASPLYGTGGCNSAPTAVNDTYNGLIGMIFSGNVMTNDTEPNGEAMTASIVNTSNNAVITLNPNGSFSIQPNALFTGNVITFTYQLTDNGFTPLVSNTATVTLNLVSAATLPVKLTSFTAILNNSKTDLKWITATEINTSHFVIEKSMNGTEFSDAGLVFATGGMDTRATYTYSDNVNTAQEGVIYYRLRSVDIDGKNQYSDIRMIRIGKQSSNSVSILTYPNPVTSELRITIPNNWQNKKISYEIINTNGQVSKKDEASNSSQTETLNISHLPSGVYIIRVSCNGETAQQKIIKQ
jgi:hypothetical protein